ncbi:MAG: hypothetical protein ACTSU5_07185 [Promethearchaeota archaeon]
MAFARFRRFGDLPRLRLTPRARLLLHAVVDARARLEERREWTLQGFQLVGREGKHGPGLPEKFKTEPPRNEPQYSRCSD